MHVLMQIKNNQEVIFNKLYRHFESTCSVFDISTSKPIEIPMTYTSRELIFFSKVPYNVGFVDTVEVWNLDFESTCLPRKRKTISITTAKYTLEKSCIYFADLIQVLRWLDALFCC